MDSDETTINELHYFQRKLETKQSKLNDEVSEKNKLKRQLIDTSTFIDQIIIKHDTVHSQLTSNYDMLWCKYQNKSKELSQNKDDKEYLFNEIKELKNNCEKLKCSLKLEKEKNTCLEEGNYKLERYLQEERENVEFLKCENRNRLKCLDKKSDDLSKVTEELSEKTDELNNEKRINRKLELQKEELSRKNEKLDLEKLKLERSKEIINLELDMKNKQNAELSQVINDQKRELQELKDTLLKYKQNNDVLKQSREKEKMEANSFIEKMRKEKLCDENQRKELQCTIWKRTEELKKLELNYENLVGQNKDLQCKLNTVTTNSEGQKQCTKLQIEKINRDKRQLQSDVYTKDQIIRELNEQLCDEQKQHKAEMEYSQKLRLKYDSLKQKAMQFENDQYTSNGYNNNSYQLTDTVSKVLEELHLNYETPPLLFSKYEDAATDSSVSGFEQFCSKLDSIVKLNGQINK